MRSMFFGLGTASVVVMGIASGCSSSPKVASTACPAGEVCTPAVMDSGTIFHRFDESGTEASTTSLVPDGTTGLPCTKDADCIGEGGAGVNKCSSDFSGTFTGVGISGYATPICLVPPSATGNCDPGTVANQLVFCDSNDPTDPSSPGICYPLNPAAPVAGEGNCLPKCTFLTDGSAATGCTGHDACSVLTFIVDANNNAQGIGICGSACQTNADCAALGATYVCEPDIGACTTALITRTLKPGEACTTTQENAGACLCLTGAGTSGFCSVDCLVGASPSACPSGWVCDSGEPTMLDFGAGAPTFPALTKQTVGASGVCLPACSTADAGTAGAPVADGGSSEDAAVVEAMASAGCSLYGTASCVTGDIAGSVCLQE